MEQLEDLESHNHTHSDEFTVAIVLGKALKNSRLSVEHAARCSTLVRQMKDGTLNPSMLMFTASAASMAPGAVRDDATTACTYFLHLCESEGVDVDAGAIHVTHTPVTTRDGMGKVLEEAIVPRLPSKSSLHCAFFASDYQLTRLERIGSVTPRLSLFAPLAARRDDIPALADSFFARYATEQGLRPPTISEEAMAALQAYDWPGNVRQLRNVVERTIILTPRDSLERIEVDMLPEEVLGGKASGSGGVGAMMGAPLREARENFEREYLTVQIRRFSGNISKTANFIGMERSALHRKLKLLGMVERKGPERKN